MFIALVSHDRLSCVAGSSAVIVNTASQDTHNMIKGVPDYFIVRLRLPQSPSFDRVVADALPYSISQRDGDGARLARGHARGPAARTSRFPRL